MQFYVRRITFQRRRLLVKCPKTETVAVSIKLNNKLTIDISARVMISYYKKVFHFDTLR